MYLERRVCGELWFIHFRCYPWLALRLVRPGDSEEQRRDAAHAFMDARTCCLDHGCSQRLRRMVQAPRDLLATDVQEFLLALFSRVVVTSTFVERIFSDLERWTKTRQSLSTIAAKHFTASFREGVSRLREQSAAFRPRSYWHRPLWLKSNASGARMTGLHLFQTNHTSNEFGAVALQRSIQDWRNLTPGERAQWNRRAKARCAVARNTMAPLDAFLHDDEPEIPSRCWGLATVDGE